MSRSGILTSAAATATSRKMPRAIRPRSRPYSTHERSMERMAKGVRMNLK
jgi:hypothetical protein